MKLLPLILREDEEVGLWMLYMLATPPFSFLAKSKMEQSIKKGSLTRTRKEIYPRTAAAGIHIRPMMILCENFD